ncbi:MAG: ornithine carbamoyltransferase [Deltaproteobacteria bacterium]|nr:ornithine carbamoyltransferase [Deltaproteobacteria bacterium]MBW2020434.1 ornithine carbamoyltransferase [Deltaproteobacteria bacterium]MBW2075178.1 ornithine carbamoyltransferase [Deltaproteobacteria bacterium]
MKKDLLTLRDLNADDCEALFMRSFELKQRRAVGIPDRTLQGKTLGLIFDKPSTRTRVSFEAAMVQLGGTSLFLNTKDTQLIRNEPIADTARVLSRYLDGLVVRTYSQDLLMDLASAASIPIINGLTDLYHPCQVLSDLMTILEKRGRLEGLKIVWVGDGNNVAHSWLNAAAILGLNLVLACPEGYQPDEAILAAAVKDTKGKIVVLSDPDEAVRDADVIYTDVWASMGHESEHERRKKVFKPYQANQRLLSMAKQDVMVMHCLPAHRGEEIAADVLEGVHSVVWDQAENKLHMHKAILERLMSDH